MSLSLNLMIVSATIDPSVEQRWNQWYNEVHMPEIIACPGFQSGQRYIAEDANGRRYLAIYEIDGPDALESAEFAARRGWGPFLNMVRFETRQYTRTIQVIKGAQP